MNLDKIEEFTNSIEDGYEFFLTEFSMDQNLIIRLDFVNLNDWELPKEIKGEVYFFEAVFYGKAYSFHVYRRHLESDSNCVLCEGNSDLFDSFENAIQDKYWTQVVFICNKYIEIKKKEEEENFNS